MGQLMQKQVGQLADNSFLETQDYTYNIRGWLKGINKDYANNNTSGGDNRWFGMELSYDWGFGTNYLNGNISGSKWRSKGNGQQRAYGFGYDDANRLLYADFNQYSGSGWDKTAGVDFSTVMGNGTNPSTAYDPNGNILAMQQEAWQLGGSHNIDSLKYTYYNNSNKLQNVIDGDNNPATTLGDFRTSSLSPYASGKTTAALDYAYDGNGNLLKDLNKDIGSLTTSGITYNYLNLPAQISFRSATGTKGTITYTYDAAGTKLKKTTLDSVGNLETVTTYIGPFQYRSTTPLTGTGSGNLIDTLQFFAHPEGRIRAENDTVDGETPGSYKADYFLKDHLGDTRMVLTDEQQTDMYPAATMEVGDSATENVYYMNLDSTRVALPPGYPSDTTTNPNNYVAEVGGSTSEPVIGPGLVLKVMAGDEFSVRVSDWYLLNGTTPGTPVNPLTDILTHMIAGMAGIPSPENPGLVALQSNTPTLSSNVFNFLQDTGTSINSSRPHAFLNWILLDNQFSYVSASSGFSQVGNSGQLNVITLTNLPIISSGYLYIYVSNETPNVPVFFDNLQVTHMRGPLLEEGHYYPFGLTIAGISDKALKANYAENKFKYNKGSELQNKEFSDGSGLEMYETVLRELDPQLGKWWQIDPRPNLSLSPYETMNNNPGLLNDPLGDTTRQKGFKESEVIVWLGKLINTNAGANPFYFYKGDLQVNPILLNRLTDDQQNIACNIVETINSKKTFTITKVNGTDVVPGYGPLPGTRPDGSPLLRYVEGDPKGKLVLTYDDFGGAATTSANADMNITIGIDPAHFQPGLKSGLLDKRGNDLPNPVWLVIGHELGGHGYYEYVENESYILEGGHAVDYENDIRRLHGLMGQRPYDTNHHDPSELNK
jgi:hypothetical protein